MSIQEEVNYYPSISINMFINTSNYVVITNKNNNKYQFIQTQKQNSSEAVSISSILKAIIHVNAIHSNIIIYNHLDSYGKNL